MSEEPGSWGAWTCQLGQKKTSFHLAWLVHFRHVHTTHLHQLLAQLHAELPPVPLLQWTLSVMLQKGAKSIVEAAVKQEEKNGKVPFVQ